MAESQHIPSRRSFIVGCGVAAAAAATAAPVVQAAFPWGSERVAGRTWSDAAAEHVKALRESYLAEIERFAATLRPRFEAGELYSFREDDSEGQQRVEDACAMHFGLGLSPDEWKTLDTGPALVILAASPHADATGYGSDYPCDHARESAAWDVLALARDRRWYTPTQDECGDPALAEVES